MSWHSAAASAAGDSGFFLHDLLDEPAAASENEVAELIQPAVAASAAAKGNVGCLSVWSCGPRALCRAILVNNYIRLGHVTHTMVAVSRRPSSRWAVDAERVPWWPGPGWGAVAQ